MNEKDSFTKLCQVIDSLLGENGCPWDKAQTHQSLRSDVLEESYEVAEAIDNEDMQSLKEELGDLLLQVMLHSKIAEKAGHFNLEEVFNHLADKLISRHSHIFGKDMAKNAEEALHTWESNKIKEKAFSTPLEYMQAVPKALPALTRAQKVIKRSNKSLVENFSTETAIEEIENLLNNLREDIDGVNNDIINEADMEICGRILFLMTQISNKKQINAEMSLTNAVQTYINSFM